MNRLISAILVMLLLAFVSAYAVDPTEEEAEQLTCGEIKNRNTSSQFGAGLWLEYIAETARPTNFLDCPWLSVSVEANVVGVSSSGHSNSNLFTASVRRQIPVPNEGEWQTDSRHYRNWMGIFSFGNGTLSSKTTVKVEPQDEESGGGYGGQCGDPETPCEAASSNGGDSASPIIIDLDRNGYHLTSLEDGVFFDLDADGAAELVSWTDALSGDAFLALDRNGNGRIDDGSELFGNYTPAYATGSSVTASNGFEALKFLENPSYGRAERNEIVNARDAAFARLQLWTDRNHNGLSEPDELQPVSDSGLLDIRTDYKTARRRDAHGNEFRQRAKARWQHGEAFVYDVWLKRRP